MFKESGVPILVITGYLGSGKTTLINNILKKNKDKRIALIVNDIGEVNIDEELVLKSGYIKQEDKGDVVPLSNGCICCTLKKDLVDQISTLASKDEFDYIIIEASGICEPLPIAQTISIMEQTSESYGVPRICYLDNVLTIVDAKRLVDEFSAGDALINSEVGEDDLEKLLIEQIEFCNQIIINKVSDVDKEDLAKVRSVIKTLQPNAEIIETDYSEIPNEKILDTHNFNFDKASSSAGWIELLENPEEEEEGEALEYGITTFVYYNRKQFDLEKFQDVIEKYSKNIIRAKGYVWTKETDNECVIFEKIGKQKVLRSIGSWIIDMPKEERDDILKYNPDVRDAWDPELGDKMNKIVFIGRDMDKASIIQDLNDAL